MSDVGRWKQNDVQQKDSQHILFPTPSVEQYAEAGNSYFWAELIKTGTAPCANKAQAGLGPCLVMKSAQRNPSRHLEASPGAGGDVFQLNLQDHVLPFSLSFSCGPAQRCPSLRNNPGQSSMAASGCPAQTHLPEEMLNIWEVLSQQALLALHQQAHKLLLCTGVNS